MEAPRSMDERRRVLRVTPLQPLSARLNDEPAYALDLSLNGFRLTHQRIIRSEGDCDVRLDWDGSTIDATTAVKWSRVRRTTGGAQEKSVYESGVEILLIDERSKARLRECVEAHVARALDEQKANAKGIPPLAVRSQQPPAHSRYARHEYLNGL